MNIKLSLSVFSNNCYNSSSKYWFATLNPLLLKKNLRKNCKKIKSQLLTKYNNNSYHHALLNNLGQVLSTYISDQDKLITIGSYINKPIVEIVPPILTHSNADILSKYKLNLVQFQYAYPNFVTLDPLDSNSLNMQFYIHNTHSTYKIGPYGIKVLDTQRLVLRNQDKNQTQKHQLINISKQLDFVFVPLVGFTQGRHRIGEGGGYYDRFIQLNRLRNADKQTKEKKTIFIGIGLEGLKICEQKTRQFQISPFRQQDQKLDLIITEKNIYD